MMEILFRNKITKKYTCMGNTMDFCLTFTTYLVNGPKKCSINRENFFFILV